MESWRLALLIIVFLILCRFVFVRYRKYRVREANLDLASTFARILDEEDEREGKRLFENRLREKARQRWLRKNQPKLYWNSEKGITAVLLPNDYDDARGETEKARRNGSWGNQDTLLLDYNTFVFADEQGLELIKKNAPLITHYGPCRFKPAGMISKLHEIARQNGVALVRSTDIFVPWVNEDLLSFKEQAEILYGGLGLATTFKLVGRQAPEEFQPRQKPR